MNEKQQWIEYKYILIKLRELKIEDKFPDIYVKLLGDLSIEKEMDAIDEKLKVINCKHEDTFMEAGHDSHYSYKITKCNNCGKTIKMETV